MKCNAARNLYSAAFDGELSVAEERDLRSHLSSCPACSREFALFTKSVKLVSSLPRPPVNPFFERKVLRELRAREATAARKAPFPLLSPRPAIAFAAAAVFLALIMVIPQNQPDLESELAMNELVPVELADVPGGPPAVSQVSPTQTVPAGQEQVKPADAPAWTAAELLASSSPGTIVSSPGLNAVAITDGGSLEVEFVLDPFLLEGAEIRRVEANDVSKGAETELVSMTF